MRIELKNRRATRVPPSEGEGPRERREAGKKRAGERKREERDAGDGGERSSEMDESCWGLKGPSERVNLK